MSTGGFEKLIPGAEAILATLQAAQLIYIAYRRKRERSLSKAEEGKTAARIERNSQDPATLATEGRTMMSEAAEAVTQRSRHDFSLVYEGSYITGVARDIERFLDSPGSLSDPTALQTLHWLVMDFRGEGNASTIDADRVKNFACAFEAWQALQERLSRLRANAWANTSTEDVATILEEISSMKKQLGPLAERITHKLRGRNQIDINSDELQRALASALTFEEEFWETVAQGEETGGEEVKKEARPKIDEGKLREAKEFARKNRMTVQEGLQKALSKAKFVLLGERHLGEYGSVSQAIVDSLAFLKKEAGLTHIALEIGRDKQAAMDRLSADDPKLREKIKSLGGPNWREGQTEVVVKALQLGLKIICIDVHTASRPKDDNIAAGATFQNYRDEEMAKLLKSQIKGSDKVLVLIGNAHVHKKVVERGLSRNYKGDELIPDTDQPRDIKRLGARLVDDHGKEKVISIRSCMRISKIDARIFLSDAPAAGDIVEGSDPVILPDTGPVKGSEKFTASDFIIIWGEALR